MGDSVDQARFIGIDASLTSTGIAFINKNGKIESFTIKPKDKRAGPRLDYIYHTTLEFLQDNVDIGAICCMEGYSYGSAGRVFEIAEGAGVIKLALAQHGIIPVIVAPSQLKKFSTGKGMWPKAVAKLKVWEAANNLNIAETIPAKEFDRSDSTVLCRIAQVIGTKEMLTIRASLEVIHELLVGKKQVKKKSTKLRTPTTL